MTLTVICEMQRTRHAVFVLQHHWVILQYGMSVGMCTQILSVLPLAAVHTLGNLLTNVSLGQVAVSFTHTIKARPMPTVAC